jgi:hypothetical protein
MGGNGVTIYYHFVIAMQSKTGRMRAYDKNSTLFNPRVLIFLQKF